MSVTSERLLLIHGHDCPRLDIRKALGSRYHFWECTISDIQAFPFDTPMAIVIDMPLHGDAEILKAQAAIATLPDPSVGRAFIIDDLTRASIVRAHAFGAEVVIPRPLKPDTLFPSIDLLMARSRARSWALDFPGECRGLEAGTEALERIFQLASSGARLTQPELFHRGDVIIDSVGESGLGRWIDAVRVHHSQTFRHSLLVTGVAVSFGQHLGMRQEDLRRLALGGLLHDIGKAAIPIDILEKPSTLTEAETITMREHADLGRQILLRNGGFSVEMIDVTAHHHEMLDGTGYPDGLFGVQISDLVRIMTISDIFAALTEERSYKPRLSSAEAFGMIKLMEGKVDHALIRAFEPIAMGTRLAA